MHPMNKHDDVKVKVAAKADTISLAPVVVVLLLVSVVVLLISGTPSGY